MTQKEFEEAAREYQWQYMQRWGKGIDVYSLNPTKTNYAKRVWLQMEYAREGLVFYEGFRDEVLQDIEIKRRLKNKQDFLLSIVLRSEHIPYNLFWPLMQEGDTPRVRKVVSEISGMEVSKVNCIKIEFAPGKTKEEKKSYLNDATSFDTYIDFYDADNCHCGLGIEVKYTEKEYKIDWNSKQRSDTIADDGTPNLSRDYRRVTDLSGYYLPDVDAELVSDELRQVWRNHILGASMVIHGDIQEFKSITIFPDANPHFHHIEPKYRKLLTNKGNETFGLLTYESYFNILEKCFNDNWGKDWVGYLKERYIIK